MDVNLLGTMRMCVARRGLMGKQGGSIVNIASMLSFFGAGLAPAYSASKGAVAQLTKSLAISWAADRIRVNAVAPGWITTSLTQRLQEDPARSAKILGRTPLKRWGKPEDIVGPALFLCSPAAAASLAPSCRLTAAISSLETKAMKSILIFLSGIIFTLIVLAGVGYFAVIAGLVPANADSKPWPLERWAAITALRAAIERDTKGLSNPIQPSDENLIAGVHLYAANCAICHGASDAKPSNPAQGFYIEAPQLAKDGVEDDPEAVSFWKMKHGIRFTAMPSFTTTLQDEEIWKIAMFLKQMDKLPPAVDAEWKRVPSVKATPPPK